MSDFLIFSLIAAFVVVPIATALFYKLYKGSVNLVINLAMTGHSLFIAILTFFVADNGLNHLWWAAPLSLVSSGAWLVVIEKNFINPIKSLVEKIDRTSDGDLSVEINKENLKRKNEVGLISKSLNQMLKNTRESVKIAQEVSNGEIYNAIELSKLRSVSGDLDIAMENMIEKLSNIMEKINTTSDVISSGSNELLQSSQNVASSTSQMAATIEQLSSSMEEMSSTIRQNSENAQEAGSLARNNSTNIEEVKNAVQSAVESMKTIASKIEIINVIADKTDLLAINASIEAARAGEAGKGFAIVASEVRKLAESSLKAANEITMLADKTVNEAIQSDEMLENIVPKIKKSEVIANEIAAASLEQSNGTDQINTGIIQLNGVTQDSASSSEELARTAESFTYQANSLKEAVTYFKLTQESKKGKSLELKKELSILEMELSEFSNEEGED